MMVNLLIALGLFIAAVLIGEYLARRRKSGARLWGDVSQMFGGLFYFAIFSLALLFEGFRWIAFIFAIAFWWVFRTKSKDVRNGTWRGKVNDG
jgi:hypothetical protein